jgi:hypothetical protein
VQNRYLLIWVTAFTLLTSSFLVKLPSSSLGRNDRQATLALNQEQILASLFQKTDFGLESNRLISSVLYRNLPALMKTISPTGANGINVKWELNQSPKWFIEAQKSGENLVIGGLVRNDPQAIQAGFKMFDWGFARQADDGSFAGTTGAFHSTSFFVQSVAHSLLVLEQSPQAGKYAAQIAHYKPRVHRAARWMIQPQIWNKGIQRNLPYTHRSYLVAAALGLTGKLTGDQELVRYSRLSIEAGLSMQRPDGANPEKGGYDSSYHMVGLVYAQRWAMYSPKDSLTPKVIAMINRGLDWAGTKILPTGEISTLGNTRTAGQETGTLGKVKGVDHKMAFRGFAYWGLVTGNPRWLELAKLISAYY